MSRHTITVHPLQVILAELSGRVDLSAHFKGVTFRLGRQPAIVLSGDGGVYTITSSRRTYRVKHGGSGDGVVRQSEYSRASEVLADFVRVYLPDSRWPFEMGEP
jgi:hypothetical protein